MNALKTIRIVDPRREKNKEEGRQERLSRWVNDELKGEIPSTAVVFVPECLLTEVEDPTVKDALARGFIAEPGENKTPKARAAYVAYILEQKERFLPYVFEHDSVPILRYFAEGERITNENFESEFLIPAQEAKALGCVAYLLDWKNSTIGSGYGGGANDPFTWSVL